MKREPYSEEYKKKVMSADEAALMVKDGFKLNFGDNICLSYDFDIALAKRINDLHDIVIISNINPRREPFACYSACSSSDHARFVSAHFGAVDRKTNKQGNTWFLPMLFHEYTGYMRDVIHPDIAVIQVSPMDDDGCFYYGPQVAGSAADPDCSDMLIVEVNSNLRPVAGIRNKIHISDVACIIEGSNPPLIEVPVPVPDECDIKIAKNIAQLVEDESTLQLGIGSLPTAVGKALAESDINEIYCHTEVMADPYVDMFESGKLKGNKYADDGKIVYGSVIGSRRVYDFVENNDLCCCAPIEYINDFKAVSEIDRFISVNGCLAADLFGQVNSESVGLQHVSGTGGQLDFALAAYMSKGGKSFLCMHSTRKLRDGTRISNIVPVFEPGTIVSTPRTAVHYLVTEFGAVNMKGLSTYERAEALISIAHPDFRDELREAAEKMGLGPVSSKVTGGL